MNVLSNTKTVTDESMMELIPHGQSDFPFQYYYEDIRSFENNAIDWHWHNQFEFVSVAEGSAGCLIGNMKLTLLEGDGIFINSGVIHRFEAPEKGIIPNILFAPKFIAPEESRIFQKFVEPISTSDISHVVFNQEKAWQQDILRYLDRAYRICHEAGNTWELAVHTLISQLWSTLWQHKEQLITIEKAGVTLLSQVRLKRMTDFIRQHYVQKLTLQDIADAADISKSEALRCFRTGILLTPIEYLNKYRLQQARLLLTTTTQTITDIAGIVGFESTSYFDRMFKRVFGLTPREMRMQ